MLHGFDLSHWQNDTIFNAVLLENNCDFIILKATEGKSMIDSTYNFRMSTVLDKDNILAGSYHFAHPELNDASAEAFNFCKTVLPYLGKTALFLDFEGKAENWKTKDAQREWILSWLYQVKACLGVTPMLYTNQYNAQFFADAVRGAGYGLWIARWGEKEPTYKHEIWQYTSKYICSYCWGIRHVDANSSNMTVDDWNTWCKSSLVKDDDTCDCYCGCCQSEQKMIHKE